MLRTTLFYFTISALYSVRARPLTERPTNGAQLCEYDGKFYVSGKIFNKKSDGKGKCSGLRCDNGVVRDWDAICSTVAPATHRTIGRKTTKRHRTTTSSTTIPLVTTLPIAITPLGCKVDGIFYNPGEEIGSGVDRKAGWCYGTYCDEEGYVVAWDNFNCFPTTTPPSTPPRTSTSYPPERTSAEPTPSSSSRRNILPHTDPPYFTDPLGCKHDGKFFGPGEEIRRQSDGHGSCFGLYCNYEGNIITWNCGATTPEVGTTATPPTTVTGTPSNPFANKRRTIAQTYPPKTTTHQSTPASTTPASTVPPYTTPISAANPPIQTTPEKPAAKRLTQFLASPTANTLLKTSPKEPTSRSSTPLHTAPQSIGWCYFNGQYFVRGEVISRVYHARNWCSGWYCNDGKIDPWNDFNCPNPNAPQQSTTNAPQCYFNGVYYNEGEVIPGGEGSGDCEGSYCRGGQLIPFEGIDCGSSAQTNSSTPESNVTTTNTNSVKTQTNLPSTTTKTPAITFTKTSTASPTTTSTHQAKDSIKTVEPKLCFHEGSYYEEGDIISRDFDADDWCSGWYCKEGRLVSLDCGVSSSVDKVDSHQLIPAKTLSPEPSRCFHEGRFYEEGDLATIGNDWCSGLLCQGGKMIPWNECAIKKFTPSKEVSPSTFKASVSATITETMENKTKLSTAVTTNAPVSTLKLTPTPESTTLPTTETTKRSGKTPARTAILITQSEAITNSPEISLTQPSTASPITSPTPQIETTTLLTEPKLCYHEGNYYEDGDIISRDFDGDNWCSGWHCQGGRLISLDCGGTTDPKTEGASSLELKPPKTFSPEPPRCFYEGRYYDEGDLAAVGNDLCSGLLCKDGKMISWDDCLIKKFTPSKEVTKPTSKSIVSDTITDSMEKETKLFTAETTKAPVSNLTEAPTASVVTTPTTQGNDSTTSLEPKRCFHEGKYYEEGDIISRDVNGDNWCSNWYCKGGQFVTLDCGDTTKPVTDVDMDSPKPVPTMTLEPEPSRCFHDGKYYDEGDLATTGKNWCSWLLCLNGEMVLWGKCVSLPRSTTLPITETTKTKTSDTTLAHTETFTTTQSEATAKSPVISLTQTSTATQVTSPRPQTEATKSSPKQARCYHDGKYYEEGDIISRDFDGDDWCSGWYCKEGRLISLDCGVKTRSVTKVDISSPRPIPLKTLGPEPSRCFHEGRYFEDGDLATIGKDWCSGLLCRDGQIISWDNCQIKLGSTPPTKIPEVFTRPEDTTTSSTQHTGTTKSPVQKSTTTLPDPTTTPRTPSKPQKTMATKPLQTTKPERQRCYYKGKLYSPGEVSRGVLRDGRCYGVICDISGIIVQWVTPTCAPTEAPTAEIKASLPGCVHREKYYPPGRISRISDGGNWCLDVICTEEGEIVSRSILNCDQSTTATSLPTTSSTPEPDEVKCLYNGAFYSPGVIKEGIDKNKWCYKVVCQDNGQLYLWGDWNCKFTLRTITTSPPKTTSPEPTICTYNEKKYPVGEITRGEDTSGWCFGVTCRHDGQVVLWGSFKCKKI